MSIKVVITKGESEGYLFIVGTYAYWTRKSAGDTDFFNRNVQKAFDKYASTAF